MSESESKHVQTELTGEEYELFREFADEQGMSLKEAGREVLVTWIERQQRADPTDQAFTEFEENAPGLDPGVESDNSLYKPLSGHTSNQ